MGPLFGATPYRNSSEHDRKVIPVAKTKRGCRRPRFSFFADDNNAVHFAPPAGRGVNISGW